MILGLETATASGGAALLSRTHLVGVVGFTTTTLYSQRLFPSVEWLLDKTGVEVSAIRGIAVSIGPGSFTGLRIGLAAAKALSYAWNAPLVGVPTLHALALRAGWQSAGQLPSRVCTILDARQGQVFAGLYEVAFVAPAEPFQSASATATPLRADHAGPLSNIADWISVPTLFAGDGAFKYSDVLLQMFGENYIPASPLHCLPGAEEVAWMGAQRLWRGESDDLTVLGPRYLRESYTQPAVL